MGAYWLKQAYAAADRDAHGEILPGVIAPGLYCEDEASFDALLARTDVQRLRPDYHAPREADRPRAWPPLSIGAIRVRVATQAETAILRTMSARPPEPEPAPDFAGVAAAMGAYIDRIMAGRAPPAS